MIAFHSLETVRSIALRFGYAEVQSVKTSLVISFQSRVISFKSMDGMIRVNVYYTTGTVATCLSHPIMGKTLLFHRNQTVESLPAIFWNPGTHAGEGYYHVDTIQGNRHWSPIKHNMRDDAPQFTACDDAQRWNFVQAATNFCSAQQMLQIAATCDLWNEIRFDRNGPSTKDVYNSFFEETKAGCGNCGHDRAGSTCVLGSVLIEVARASVGPDDSIAFFYPTEDELSDRTIQDDERIVIPCDAFRYCRCAEGIDYQRSLAAAVERFRRQLMAFPEPIRRELTYFFLKKLVHRYYLMTESKLSHYSICSKTDPHTGEEKYLSFYEERFLSDEILSAHHDYGELTYGDESMVGKCNCFWRRLLKANLPMKA